MDLDEGEEPPALIEQRKVTQGSTVHDAVGRDDGPVARVPITIVTGYLGSGKTTLMNYLLGEQHGKKIAVILNGSCYLTQLSAPSPDRQLRVWRLLVLLHLHRRLKLIFAISLDIEKSLTINHEGQEVQEWLEIGNGCICCSVKDSGVNAIESLMDRKGAFDYILLETSGLADPGNIAPLFWLDDGLGSSIYLDGIVTVVDAGNILKSLEENSNTEPHSTNENSLYAGNDHTIAHMQISHADVIILNKCDVVSNEQRKIVKNRVERINSLAQVVETTHSKVPSLDGTILNLHAYDQVNNLDAAASGHSHLDTDISTVSISFPQIRVSQLDKLDVWLQKLLWDGTIDEVQVVSKDTQFAIYRLKGRVVLDSGSIKMVQGVREVFEINECAPSSRQETILTTSKLIFIGKGLNAVPLERSLRAALQ